jgi:hypothetical protein
MTVYANHVSTLHGTCGTGLISNFESYRNSYSYNRNIKDTALPGGAGWVVAGFINNEVCKEAYEIMKGRCKIVLQTPVRRNFNSRNRFFFIVYDKRGVRKSKNNPSGGITEETNAAYKWPFK